VPPLDALDAQTSLVVRREAVQIDAQIERLLKQVVLGPNQTAKNEAALLDTTVHLLRNEIGDGEAAPLVWLRVGGTEREASAPRRLFSRTGRLMLRPVRAEPCGHTDSYDETDDYTDNRQRALRPFALCPFCLEQNVTSVVASVVANLHDNDLARILIEAGFDPSSRVSV
jgi:hypothetical protein